MNKQILISLKILLVMTILTGIIYPFIITGIAQVIFNHKANGSFIKKNNIVIGSQLIGQKFDSSIYFWSRPSSIDYNPLPSGGSNYGPTSEKLKKFINDKRTKFASLNNISDTLTVPVEMITASASGLDPDISQRAALMQVNRVAKARNFSASQIQLLENIIRSKTQKAQYTLFGEERINVLQLNLELDKLK